MLVQKEIDLLECLASGWPPTWIASELGITQKFLKDHLIPQIRRKLQIPDKISTIQYAVGLFKKYKSIDFLLEE